MKKLSIVTAVAAVVFASFLMLANLGCEKDSALGPQIDEAVGEDGGVAGGGTGGGSVAPGEEVINVPRINLPIGNLSVDLEPYQPQSQQQIDPSKLPKLELPETIPGGLEQYKPQPRVVIDFNAVPKIGKELVANLGSLDDMPGMIVVNTGPVEVYKKDPNDQWQIVTGKYVSGKMLDGQTPFNVLTIDKLVLATKKERNLKLKIMGEPVDHAFEIDIGGKVVSSGWKMKPQNVPGEKGYDLQLLIPDAGVYGEAKNLDILIADAVTGAVNAVRFKSIVYEGACEYYGGITLNGQGQSADPHRIDKGYEFWVAVKDGGWGKLTWTVEDEVGWYRPNQPETEWINMRNCGSLKNVALINAKQNTYYGGRLFSVKTDTDYPDCIYNASMSELESIFEGQYGGSELERITIRVKDECGYTGMKQFIYMLDYHDPYDQDIMDVVSCSEKRYKPSQLCDGKF